MKLTEEKLQEIKRKTGKLKAAYSNLVAEQIGFKEVVGGYEDELDMVFSNENDVELITLNNEIVELSEKLWH